MIPRPGPQDYVLALMSALACAAIVGCFPSIAVKAWLGEGPPLEERDVIAGSIFVGLSLLTVVIVLKAIFRKDRKGFLGGRKLAGGPEAHGAQLLVTMPELVGLARACGVVAIIGFGGGLWAGREIRGRFVSGLLEAAERWCGSPSALGFSDEPSCVDRARDCIRQGWALPADAIARAPALREALLNRRLALERNAADQARQGGWSDDGDSRFLARLVDELRDSSSSPTLAKARHAALVCLAQSGGVAF